MATNVFDLYAKIGIDSSGYDKGIGLVKSSMTDFGKFVKSGLGKIGDLVSAGAKKAASEATGFLKSSIKTGMSFDAAMAQVAATLGKSVDEVQDLRDFAKKMGETTRYSASEAAAGLNYMALAGYDAEKSMKMLPEVMKLASAGGMELGHASDVITDAQSALGLSIEQTSTLINQMAKTASSSNTSVSQLGEAILQIGGTAKDMKGGTLELATSLGILANNGIKGAEGGTALRNILTSLTGKEGKAAEALESMNVSLFDAQGNMRDLNSVFSDMDKAMSKMTTQERKKMITTIFNARDMKSVEALLANAGTAWDDLTEKIRESEGAAADMSKTQESTLTGAITMMKSAIEGVKINISEFFTPVLTKIVSSGTTAVQTISSSIRKVGEAFKKDGFMGLLKSFKEEFSKIKDEAYKSGSKVLENIVASIAGNAKTIGEGAAKFITNFTDTLSNSKVLPLIGDAALGIIDGIGEGFASSGAVESFLVAAPKFLSSLFDGVTKILAGDGDKGGLLGAVEKILVETAKWMENPDNRQKFLTAAERFLTSFCKQAKEILDHGFMILSLVAQLFLDTFLGDIDYDHGAIRFWESFGKSLKENASGWIKGLLFGNLDVLGTSMYGKDYVSDPQMAKQMAWNHIGRGITMETDKEFENEWQEALKNNGGTATAALWEILERPQKGVEDTYKSMSLVDKMADEQYDKYYKALKSLENSGMYIGKYYDWLWEGETKSEEEKADYIRKLYVNRQTQMYNTSGLSDAEKEQWLASGTTLSPEDWYSNLSEADKIRLYKERHPDVYIPGYADGAIVSKPTLAMIGEGGEPEAVVPLGHETETSRALGLGGGITVQFGDIYVQGGENAGRDFINQVNEQLRNLEIRQLRGIGGTAWQH